MQATFLLGPAGSGKTWRCLKEIREELVASPQGPPLLLLAPKQATFQLERQLLADEDLAGYTRLQIAAFDRLAEVIVDAAGSPFRLLDEEGRVMVLRALLARKERAGDLRLFRAVSSLPGFSRELSGALRELQRHSLSPASLRRLAGRADLSFPLANKLADLALMLETYEGWLRERGLQDSDQLPTRAVELLCGMRSGAGSPLRIGGLWMDGFAEMTPQELDLLAALAPFCDKVTLAFCLDHEPAEDPLWLSTWAVVARTFRECRSRFEAVEGCEVKVEFVPRNCSISRFASGSALGHLKAHWGSVVPPEAPPVAAEVIALRACADPESEAVEAARQIMRHVRDRQGRYRECAVLLRSLDGYADILRRVFTRYEIPHFMDQREPIAHHPLAELIRHTLRAVAGGWQIEDWLGVLKTGLLPANDEELDELENEALKHGWTGMAWRRPFPTSSQPARTAILEALRQRLMRPFLAFEAALGDVGVMPTGAVLSAALRALWDDLGVADQLQRWRLVEADEAGIMMRREVHATVWEQMNAWLDNLELAFAEEAQGLWEWLAIIEAGLGGLTVGVIPPALDQVLVGAVDRSRNPELRLAVICGLNEGGFPLPPARGGLINDADREEMAERGARLAPGMLLRLGHERYLAYIACTRASERLVVTWSQNDSSGNEMKPSLFVDHLRRLFPGQGGRDLAPELGGLETAWPEAENAGELAPVLLRNQAVPESERDAALGALEGLPCFDSVLERWRAQHRAEGVETRLLQVGRLYGSELATSVSALEMFSACPFKFLVGRGLGAEERELYEVNDRKRGEFQHQALQLFHERIRESGRQWRDLGAEQARELMRALGNELLGSYGTGLFASSTAARFEAGVLVDELVELAGVLTEWALQYGFDPAEAEVRFGLPDSRLPGWTLDLDEEHKLVLRGVIDRVDLCRIQEEGTALVAVQDYKSTVRPLHPRKLAGGLQLQLLSYLGALRGIHDVPALFGVRHIIPAGVFYIPLRAAAFPAGGRAEALANGASERRNSLVHQGRFDARWRAEFDQRSHAIQGDQFRYKLTKEGKLARRGSDGLPPDEFARLLDENEEHLRRIGRAIFEGDAAVAPYRLGSECACDRCDYRSICRFDPWAQPYRKLPAPKPPPDEATRAERKEQAW